MKRGMLAARGEYCLLMDADGATRFADLERLEAELDKILAPSGWLGHGGKGFMDEALTLAE